MIVGAVGTCDWLRQVHAYAVVEAGGGAAGASVLAVRGRVAAAALAFVAFLQETKGLRCVMCGMSNQTCTHLSKSSPAVLHTWHIICIMLPMLAMVYRYYRFRTSDK